MLRRSNTLEVQIKDKKDILLSKINQVKTSKDNFFYMIKQIKLIDNNL